MNWEAIGAIAELLGSVAVLGTLVYLAMQIRQNTKFIKASTYRDAIGDFSNNIEQLNQDADLNRIWYEGMKDFDSLPKLDQQRFATYCTGFVRRYENVLFQVRVGVLEFDAIRGMEEHMRFAFSQPGTRRWWSRADNLFNAELRDHVENHLIGGS